MKYAFLSDFILEACTDPENRLSHFVSDKSNLSKLGFQIKNWLQTSKRFVVSDAIVDTALSLDMNNPMIVNNLIYSSRLPFDNMYMEFSLGPIQAAYESDNNSCTDLNKLGIFVRRIPGTPAVYQMSVVDVVEGAIGNKLNLCVVSNEWCIEKPDFQTSAAKSMNEYLGEDSTAKMLFGTNGTLFSRNITDETMISNFEKYCFVGCNWILTPGNQSSLLAPVLYGNTMPPSEVADTREMILSDIQSLPGLWRLVVTILGLMNQESDRITVSKNDRKQKSRLVKGKLVPYSSNHIVDINLPKSHFFQKIISNKIYAKKRRHEVEGHYKYSRKPSQTGSPTCVHEYTKDGNTETCQHCGKKRWWTNSFLRGDENLGFVTKEYRIKHGSKW